VSDNLTETTVRYLYAAEWLPSSDREHLVAVPGGATKALDTAANLLHIAMWSLRRRGLMGFEQLREVEDEPVRTFGGRSFSRFERLAGAPALPGLEGALLRAAETISPSERLRDKAIDRMSGEDDFGVRRLITALDLDHRGPWRTVCGHCYAEAHAAGLVERKGLLRRLAFSDLPAVEALRARHDELRAARGAYLEAEPELTNAVMSDCLRTIADAYSPSLGG
jgi:hypothetical protein